MPVLFQAIFDVIHRPTDQLTFFVCLPKMNRKRNFRKFCTHTKDRGDPHPENGTRSTDRDRSRHTGNVSGSDSCRKCRTDCLKRCKRTVRCLSLFQHTPQCHFHRIGKFADLKETGPDTQQQSDPDDTDHRRNSPDEIIYHIIYRLYYR